MPKENNIYFTYNSQGYADAVVFLKGIGRYEEVTTKCLSKDWWSVVQAANDIYEKMNSWQIYPYKR